ncbi:MAG: aldehyde ferredoxin oxidoreductase, partial [Spirochaetota bacterium]
MGSFFGPVDLGLHLAGSINSLNIGAGLVFDNLGVNMIAVTGRAPRPSVLVLNREHGEEVQVRVEPVGTAEAWSSGEGGVYGQMEQVHRRYGEEYTGDPRILAVGPAAEATDMGAVCSAPIT